MTTHSNHDYLDSYRQAKVSLNPEQQEAVEAIEGPVLVIAGPGTGKTQVLALRIAEILNEQPDIDPGNLLCLTFTNAGAIAMRQRLLTFIGHEAHKVQIHTFHSFCNQVIQENASYFGVRETENVGELEQYELMEAMIDALPARHLLFHKSSYHEIKNLLDLFSAMKQENWNVEDIETAVNEYLAEIPQREDFLYKRKYKEFNAGDPNPKKIREEEEKMQRLLAGVRLFPEYQKRMQENGWYDYQDMIQWVIRAFRENETLLAKYQERFQYILVDEFQDTNGAQKTVLDLLIDYWETPNVFVVGDDDQSIYRFQGANLRNIMEFYEKYKAETKVVCIEKNYRSTPAVLDLAEHVINANTERLVHEIPNLEKHLTAEHADYKAAAEQPKLVGYYNTAHEELGIINRLQELRDAGTNLSDVAVIYQNHHQVANILKLCEMKEIPVRVKETADILSLPLIQQVIELLHYFCDEAAQPFSREDILFRSLYFRCFELTARDIGLLALWRRADSKNRFLKLILQNPEELATIKGITDAEKLAAIGRLITELEQDFVDLPIALFVEAVFNKTGILQQVMAAPDRSFQLRALTTFMGFVRETAEKDTAATVANILDILQRMHRHGLTLPIHKIAYEDSGVNFITAHSAKGLEFEHVFLIGVDKKVWERKQRDLGFSFPDTLTRSNAGDFLEEKRRLLFVALTRAKRYLEVSFAERSENGKELEPSQFVSELAEKITIEQRQSNADAIDDYQFQLLQIPIVEDVPIIEPSILKQVLEGYRMSATHLNAYLRCPLSFYFEYILRIPGAPNAHAAFGTAVHIALEREYQQAKLSGTYGDGVALLKFFEEDIARQRYAFTESEFQKFLAHGKEVLAGYFAHFLANKPVAPTHTEYRISTHLHGVPAIGELDKIEELEPGKVRITDYKTGNADSRHTTERLAAPSDKNNLLGGDYWRQVVFYTLLLENDAQKKWQVAECAIDFVEPKKDGSCRREVFRVTEADKQIVLEQITDSYQRIQNMEFPGCKEEDCVWCNLG